MTIIDQIKSLKILFIGDSRTGKTSILSRLSKDAFALRYEPTIKLRLEACNIRMDTDTVNVVVWDSEGGENRRTMVNHYSHDADGILLLYDITDFKTFKNITERIKDILEMANPNAVIKLVGNKCDLDHQRAVPTKEAEQWAIDRGISFNETSALDASNITTTFQWMIQQIRPTIHSLDSNSGQYPFSTCGFVCNCVKKDPCSQESFYDGTEKQRPFHVILIDLKKAARNNIPIIHCVEKPLEDPDLKYVALSYRWGEWQEKLIDTHIGYTAKITSFDINDFYMLCYKMVRDVDLKYMDYVWVDAICIDQTNYERRKATIYQMTNIYQRASYILAVPDLHLKYLRVTSDINEEIIRSAIPYRKDIYYLIHGNAEQLARIEEEWLDKCKVPDNPQLRQLLKSSTDHFTDGLMNPHTHHRYYNAEECLHHIYESSQTTALATQNHKKDTIDKTNPLSTDNVNILPQKRQHDCDQEDCPLDFFNDVVPKWREENVLDNDKTPDFFFRQYNRQWKQRIQERSTSIGQYMKFIASVVRDWSTRVWVISEYNIAKKKNNMKFWFVHLNYIKLDNDEDITFFNFDFKDTTLAASIQHALKDFHYDYKFDQRNNPFYLTFHQTLHNQLNEQTFLEMMLKSKASKNEDRFYAIFPLSEYKNILSNKAMVDSWKIDTLSSVKLKLFEIVNTKEKLNLLFIGGRLQGIELGPSLEMGKILPTFVTSSIDIRTPMEYFRFKDSMMDPCNCNFDLNDTNTIKFHQQSDHLDTPFLNLKPREFYTIDYNSIDLDDAPAYGLYADRTLWSQLQSQDPYQTNVIVAIPSWNVVTIKAIVDKDYWPDWFMFLNGNFKNNIWIVERARPEWVSVSRFRYWKRHTTDDISTGFNIY